MTQHLELFTLWASRVGLRDGEFCLVAGTSLAEAGIRENNDFDVVVSNTERERLRLDELYSDYLDEGDLCKLEGVIDVKSRWGAGASYLDDELVHCDAFHFIGPSGLKAARPEVVMAVKNSLRRGHDIRDIPLIAQWALANQANWDWGLFRDPCAPPKPPHTAAGTQGGAALLARIARTATSPRRLLRSARFRLQALKHKVLPRGCAETRARDRFSLKGPMLWGQGVSVPHVLSNQYRDGVFNRYDILVRCLAARGIRDGEGTGEALYRAMQAQRPRAGGHSFEAFQTLAHSVAATGLDPDCPIELGPDGHLWDGSHRLALAAFLGDQFIGARYRTVPGSVVYGRQWFEDHGFREEDLELLDTLRDELFLCQGVYFQVVLWPPAAPFAHEVAGRIAETYAVRAGRVLDFTKEPAAFGEFVKQVYAVDDIAPWKVARKLWAMSAHPPIVNVLSIEIPHPSFRAKTSNPDRMICLEAEDLKRKIRASYSARVEKYFYDTVVHMGDSFLQNALVWKMVAGKSAARCATCRCSDTDQPGECFNG